MAFTKSPGITVSEIDLSAVTPAIGTTEAAIAGHFRWGPVGERALITTEDELVKTFQRKYRQNLINGRIDQECLSISKNLIKIR